ncbi:MAG: valine--tRNA ligase [Patescibacteria group bacterium]|jgi:valyl-tRNA synthetase
MDKAYEAKQVEDKIYQIWEESGFFNPDNLKGKDKYCNVLPPPNANGELHIGHASGYVVMDFFGRYQRMLGKKVLLLPGKDHAGIQTQVVYEKKLKKEQGKTRYDLGREEFYKGCYEFCLDRANYMRNQERRIGLSADWSREKFTLDPDLIKTVSETFVEMSEEGLIYRGPRIISWCPRCFTALSDIEVEYEEQDGKLYTFKYDADFPFTISTTRPETKLGDTAVAVNPKDERYQKYIGQTISVNFLGVPLKLKIIADDGVDMNFGTGALGVTPAHSMVDYEMAQKHDLEIIRVIDQQGKIIVGNDNFKAFKDLTALEAREKVVADLRQAGLLIKEEEYKNNLSVCERCKTSVEQLISEQWFVNVDDSKKSLKKMAKRVIEKGDIKIYPEKFKKTMLDWIDNVHDWCISRQIWWGPRIPAWYHQSKGLKVSLDSPGEGWKQDEDTLDTWFSSGQWVYTTLGYPKGKDFKDFYPTDSMIMGRDLIFFWAFRMIIMSLYKTGKAPFKNLYFTGLIRDEQGRKMSKSKGNGIEPLEMISKYGTDAVRLSLVIGSAPGSDMNLGEEKIAGFRNFTNKFWNISRFILMMIGEEKIADKTPKPKTLADAWILSRLQQVIEVVTFNIEKFNLSLAGEILRDFTWNELADWYLEIAKIEGEKKEILAYILRTVLKLWHPLMPFVTEEVWSKFNDGMILVAPWPKAEKKLADESVGKDFLLVQEVVSVIRNLRSENKVEPGKKIKAVVKAGDNADLVSSQKEIITTLARLSELEFIENGKPDKSAVAVVGGVEVYLPLADLLDIDKEKERIAGEIEMTKKYCDNVGAKLSNDDFVARAPQAVVDGEKKKLEQAKEKLEKLTKQWESL